MPGTEGELETVLTLKMEYWKELVVGEPMEMESIKFVLYCYSFGIKLCLLVPEVGETAKIVIVANHFLKVEQDLGLIMNLQNNRNM